MKTTSTPRRPKPGTQCAIILEILERTAPGFAGVNILMHQARCCATHSAIAKLRSYGWNIENRQRTKGGRRLSSYRLIPNPDEQP